MCAAEGGTKSAKYLKGPCQKKIRNNNVKARESKDNGSERCELCVQPGRNFEINILPLY